MNQLFYNIAGGIVHQIRCKKNRQYHKWLFSEASRDRTDAKSPFPLFFSFSASFKNSSPREKVAKLSSFWDQWAEFLFVSIIVGKYNIFPLANNGRSHKKKFWQIYLLTLSVCTIWTLSMLTYTEFDCVALLAMLHKWEQMQSFKLIK